MQINTRGTLRTNDDVKEDKDSYAPLGIRNKNEEESLKGMETLFPRADQYIQHRQHVTKGGRQTQEGG